MIGEAILFRDLEQLLLGGGFHSFLTPQGYRAITHEASNTIFLLCLQVIMPYLPPTRFFRTPKEMQGRVGFYQPLDPG